MKVSVIICSYNRERYIKAALESMVAQDFSPDDFEAIVVDNNSKDNTEAVCRSFISQHSTHNLLYLTETAQGSSFARNTGAQAAKGEVLCFMDDDAVAEKDFVATVWNFYTAHRDTGGFGGRIIPRYIPSEPAWMSHFVSSLVGNFDYSADITEFKPNKYPLESNMAVPKKVFDEVHGFSEALPGVKGELRIGGEGKDLYFRIKEKGFRIYYVPNMVVHHVVETEKLDEQLLFLS
jgi:glucosyl-dolichyl phosphate glucuronosyltransferase